MFKVKSVFMNAEPGAGTPPTSDPAGDDNKDDGMVSISQEELNGLRDSIKRLEQHNERVIGEKREAERLAKEAASKQQAEELEANKHKMSLEDYGKEVNRQWQEKFDANDERMQMLEMRLEEQSQSAIINELAGKFADPSIAQLALKNMVRTPLNDDLQPQTQFTDMSGKVVATDSKQFVEYLEANHSNWMKGAESSKVVVEQSIVELNNTQTPVNQDIQVLQSKVPGFKDLPRR